eukprot:4912569-Amphidinium_carterae.1
MFKEGFAATHGHRTLAAIAHYCPDLAHQDDFIRAKRAVKGWSRLRPPLSKPPTPMLAVMGTIGAMIYFVTSDIFTKLWEFSWDFWLTFDLQSFWDYADGTS